MDKWIESHLCLPEGVSIRDEKENAYSHFAGIIIALISLIYLLGSDSLYPKTGMIVFALSNLVLYAASSFYHCIRVSNAKRILRVLDHSSIYFLIAGSYTPILMHVGTPLARAYTAAMWLAVLAAIAMTLLFWGRFKVFHVILYIAMGWSIVLFRDSILPAVPSGLFKYMLTGGIIYTIGVAFYAAKPIPHHHLIWHLFVLAGSLSFIIGYTIYLF